MTRIWKKTGLSRNRADVVVFERAVPCIDQNHTPGAGNAKESVTHLEGADVHVLGELGQRILLLLLKGGRVAPQILFAGDQRVQVVDPPDLKVGVGQCRIDLPVRILAQFLNLVRQARDLARPRLDFGHDAGAADRRVRLNGEGA